MFSSYDMKRFGDYIRNARLSNRLTQLDVKLLSGLNENTLRKIEGGYVIPKYETLEILSTIYKIDLLGALLIFRTDRDLYHFYELIDEIVINGDHDLIVNIQNDFSLQNSEYHSKLVNHIDHTQLKILLSSLEIYISDDQKEFEKSIVHLVESITLTLKNFTLAKIDKYKYTPLEIRSLMLIALLYIKMNRIESSNDILIFIFNYFYSNTPDSSTESKLYLKVIYNIAYNYHRLDNHANVIHYSNLGINLLKKVKSYDSMGLFLARIAIAESKLQLPNYLDTCKKATSLLTIVGDTVMLKYIENVFIDIYDFDIGK